MYLSFTFTMAVIKPNGCMHFYLPCYYTLGGNGNKLTKSVFLYVLRMILHARCRNSYASDRKSLVGELMIEGC